LTETELCPAEATVTTPPQVHWHCDESSSAGVPPIVTCVAPGVHGVRTGTQGWGVPDAEATAGFAVDVQSPKGGTLLEETSVTTPAASVAETSAPDAENVEGTVPNEHCRLAPVQTWVGIAQPPPSLEADPIAKAA
jgi:hypothetical protein